MSEELKALRDIITNSINSILDICESSGQDFPCLSKPVDGSEFTPDGIRNDPVVSNSISTAVAASFQLIATLQSPPTTLATMAFRSSLPAALGVAEAVHVAEILRMAGPRGLHVKDICNQSPSIVDSKKLSRILRFLATNHWFNEVAPDVYSNNLLSSLLDTKKSPSELEFSDTKHKGSSGLAAIVGYGADEVLKSMSYLPETLLDPDIAFSEEPNETSFQRALGTQLDNWEYYDSGSKLASYRRDRFSIAMSGTNKLYAPKAIVSAFDWGSLPKGSLIVDVGAGKGHVSLEIARAFPDLRIVVEDRAAIIEEAKEYWRAELPSHVEDSKVEFVAASFFNPQPKLSQIPKVFVMRMITHDWSDKYCIKILKNLRLASGADTRLIIIDSVMKYACKEKNSETPTTDGPPYPLLPNLGGANILSYAVDIQMLALLNAAERTIDNFKNIINGGDWRLVEVRKNPSSKVWWPSLICAPA